MQGYRRVVVMVAVVLTALYLCVPILRLCRDTWNSREAPSWVGVPPGTQVGAEKICDIDTRLIHDGLLLAPRFRDTARWWSGTWVGQVPFYRPLTSMLFWTEWKLWGDNERPSVALGVLLHLWAVFEFARFADTLFRRFRVPKASQGVLVAGLTFVTGLFILSNEQDILAEVFSLWKNQPDAVSLALFCLTLRSYLKSRPSQWTRVASLALYALLCFTKEAGAFLPLLLPILEASELLDPKTRRSAVVRLVPFFGLMALYLLLRRLFLHQAVGYVYGSNQAWDYRLGLNVLGPISEAVFAWKYYPLMLALAVGIGTTVIRTIRRRGKRLPFAAELVLGAVLLASAGAVAGLLEAGDGDVVNGLLRFCDARTILAAFGIAAFFTTFRVTIERRFALAIFAYVWALLALALTMFSPSVLHRYYLMNAGYALLIGAGTGLLGEKRPAKPSLGGVMGPG